MDDAGIAPSGAILTFRNTLVLNDRSDFNNTAGHNRPLVPPIVLPNLVQYGAVDTWPEWQHTIEYDLSTANSRPLRIRSNTLCAAFMADRDGSAWVVSGLYTIGLKHVRSYDPCPFSVDSTCDFNNYIDANNNVMIEGFMEKFHWYGTPITLHDGQRLVVGGSIGAFAITPSTNTPFASYFPRDPLHRRPWTLQILTDSIPNNQYPFVYVLPPVCRMFIFAGNKSAIYDYCTQTEIFRFKDFPDAFAHSYPATGTVLPRPMFATEDFLQLEFVVCGGATFLPSGLANQQVTYNRLLQNDSAVDHCGRINIGCWGRNQVCDPVADSPTYTLFDINFRRVLTDGILLANGDYLLINGAQQGHASYNSATLPNLTPEICRFEDNTCQIQGSTPYARGYHSIAIQLPNATVHVSGGGSQGYGYETNPAKAFIITTKKVEIFTPPYLMMGLPVPVITTYAPRAFYGRKYTLNFKVSTLSGPKTADLSRVQLNIYANPAITHSMQVNQRLMKLVDPRSTTFTLVGDSSTGAQEFQLTVLMPKIPSMAPPMWYLFWVLYDGVPCQAAWVPLSFGSGY